MILKRLDEPGCLTKSKSYINDLLTIGIIGAGIALSIFAPTFASAHSIAEIEIFCKKAKDYKGCVSYHEERSRAFEERMGRILKKRRKNGDIVIFDSSSIVALNNYLPRGRYLGWKYLMYYFTPTDSLPLIAIHPPEDPQGYVYAYGPVLWTVEADCLEQTANWIGDNKPWLHLRTMQTESSAEAQLILERYCGQVK